MAATVRAAVGRDAPIPPDLAAAQTPAGGYAIRPYGYILCFRPNGKVAAKPDARAALVHRVFHNKKGLLPKKGSSPFFYLLKTAMGRCNLFLFKCLFLSLFNLTYTNKHI